MNVSSGVQDKQPQYHMKVCQQAIQTLFYHCTNLERCVEHNQLGTCGYNIIALVGFHKAHVNITLRFSSCKKEKSRNILLEE